MRQFGSSPENVRGVEFGKGGDRTVDTARGGCGICPPVFDRVTFRASLQPNARQHSTLIKEFRSQIQAGPIVRPSQPNRPEALPEPTWTGKPKSLAAF